MKLNLLPTHVSKEAQTRTAVIVSVLIAVVSIGLAVFLVMSSSSALEQAKSDALTWEQPAKDAVTMAKRADEIISNATILDRNVRLAQEMNKHNAVYVRLYREVLSYVPSYFRVTSIAAAPNGPQNCTVTMTGVIGSFQQYADLMLALLRIPDATNVGRNGYQVEDPYVPNLIESDQIGTPIRPGAVRIPSDPLLRLEQIVSGIYATDTGYTGQGNFGTGLPGARGAAPGESQITVTVAINNRPLQTPNPRATMNQQTASAGGQPASQTPPAGGRPPTPPPAATTPPSRPSGGGGIGGRNRNLDRPEEDQ
jgi:uncharacterized protein (UPF0333 family)